MKKLWYSEWDVVTRQSIFVNKRMKWLKLSIDDPIKRDVFSHNFRVIYRKRFERICIRFAQIKLKSKAVSILTTYNPSGFEVTGVVAPPTNF